MKKKIIAGMFLVAGIILTKTTFMADAALAASIFHYRESTVGEIKQYLKSCGVPVRSQLNKQ